MVVRLMWASFALICKAFEHQIVAGDSFHHLHRRKSSIHWHFFGQPKSKITFVNAIKFRLRMPSPRKMHGRCASAMIIRKYFCKCIGNLYHNDSYEMSAKRRKISVVDEPTEQNKNTQPVLNDTLCKRTRILESMVFNTCGGKSNISKRHRVITARVFTNSSSKFVVEM